MFLDRMESIASVNERFVRCVNAKGIGLLSGRMSEVWYAEMVWTSDEHK